MFEIQQKNKYININDNLQQMIDSYFEEFVFSKRTSLNVFSKQKMYKNDLFSIITPGVSSFDVKTYLATSEIEGLSIKNGWLVNFKTRESRANMQPNVNTVWFAKMKNSIKHLFLNEEMSPVINTSILSTGFYGLQCTDLSFEYVASWINNKNFEFLKDKLSHGATQQGVTDEDLKNMFLLVPNDSLLLDYHNKTKNWFSLLSKNLVENNQLTKLRDTLLPMLMNGQATIVE